LKLKNKNLPFGNSVSPSLQKDMLFRSTIGLLGEHFAQSLLETGLYLINVSATYPQKTVDFVSAAPLFGFKPYRWRMV
jgi:hypothetical protein